MIFNLSFSPSKNMLDVAFAGNERRVNVAFAENERDVDVAFAENAKRMVVIFREKDQRFGIDFGEGYGGAAYYPMYTGAYDVTPSVGAQSLKTSHKVLQKDVTIEAIPYAEVKNNANGKTVTIA